MNKISCATEPNRYISFALCRFPLLWVEKWRFLCKMRHHVYQNIRMSNLSLHAGVKAIRFEGRRVSKFKLKSLQLKNELNQIIHFIHFYRFIFSSRHRRNFSYWYWRLSYTHTHTTINNEQLWRSVMDFVVLRTSR